MPPVRTPYSLFLVAPPLRATTPPLLVHCPICRTECTIPDTEVPVDISIDALFTHSELVEIREHLAEECQYAETRTHGGEPERIRNAVSEFLNQRGAELDAIEFTTPLVGVVRYHRLRDLQHEPIPLHMNFLGHNRIGDLTTLAESPTVYDFQMREMPNQSISRTVARRDYVVEYDRYLANPLPQAPASWPRPLPVADDTTELVYNPMADCQELVEWDIGMALASPEGMSEVDSSIVQ